MKKKSVAAAMKSTGVRRSLRSRNSSSAPQTPFLKRRKTEDVKSPFFNQSSSKAGATKKDQAESLEVALYDGSNEDPEDPVSELHDGLSDIEEELLKNRPSRNQTRVAVSSDDDDSESSFQENAATEEDTSSGESDIDDNVSDSSVVSEAPAPRKKVSRAQPRRLNDSPVPVLQGVSTTDSATDPVNTASLEIAIETPALDAEIVSQEPGAPATATGRQRGRRRAPKKKKDPKQEIKENHPELISVWEDLEHQVALIQPERAEQPEDVNVKLLPFQLEGLNWLMKQEESPLNGGILADEMGMGKTIQVISLLVTKSHIRPNLIVCPTVAIIQWMEELKNRTTKDLLKVLVFHGNNRTDSLEELQSYDVVLSTYAIIEQGFRKMMYGVKRKGELVKMPSILHSFEWGRVVLDEAHAIKDRSCSTARAVFALKRQKQWAMSGTPLQNRVGELYSLVRFMNADPFSYYFCKKCPCKMQVWKFTDRMHCDACNHTTHQHFCWWNAEILKPIQNNGATGEGLEAFQKLGLLLDRMMLRRTKVERSDEMGLPPRIVTVRKDVFNEAEEELYDSLYSDSKRTFSTYVAENTVLNHYASIFSLLSRMRLAVNHPDLVTTKLALANNSAKETLVCGICHEECEDPILSKCKHVFCREDARQYVQSAPDDQALTCPLCFKHFSIDLTQPEMEHKACSSNANKSIVNYIDLTKWRSSTKIEALVEELTALQKDNSVEKAIVFSQFVAFLDLIQWRLSRAGFNVVKLDGRMSPAQRDTAIKMFMTDPSITVFLISLKAGGVALNLTEASRCYVLDPWWNPAVEDQAFDRIHRLGQYRPIKITRLIIENSIESRILQLQQKKKALFDSTIGKDMSAMAQLSEEDLRFLFVL